jgi:hypothetical protein
LREQLDKWIEHDVIEPSSSPWSFAMVAAPKKGGAIRWCIDYRLLNKVTLNDSISLSGIEDNLARLSGSSVFSGVDGAGAYQCVGVHKADRPKMPFLLLSACGSLKGCRLAFAMPQQHISV